MIASSSEGSHTPGLDVLIQGVEDGESQCLDLIHFALREVTTLESRLTNSFG